MLCGGCITEYGFKYLGDAIPGDTASAVDPDRPDPTDSAFMDKCDISLLRVDAIPVDPPAPPSFSCVFTCLPERGRAFYANERGSAAEISQLFLRVWPDSLVPGAGTKGAFCGTPDPPIPYTPELCTPTERRTVSPLPGLAWDITWTGDYGEFGSCFLDFDDMGRLTGCWYDHLEVRVFPEFDSLDEAEDPEEYCESIVSGGGEITMVGGSPVRGEIIFTDLHRLDARRTCKPGRGRFFLAPWARTKGSFYSNITRIGVPIQLDGDGSLTSDALIRRVCLLPHLWTGASACPHWARLAPQGRGGPPYLRPHRAYQLAVRVRPGPTMRSQVARCFTGLRSLLEPV